MKKGDRVTNLINTCPNCGAEVIQEKSLQICQWYLHAQALTALRTVVLACVAKEVDGRGCESCMTRTGVGSKKWVHEKRCYFYWVGSDGP